MCACPYLINAVPESIHFLTGLFYAGWSYGMMLATRGYTSTHLQPRTSRTLGYATGTMRPAVITTI